MKKYLNYIATARKILEVILFILDKILNVFEYVEVKDYKETNRAGEQKKYTPNGSVNIEDNPDFVHNKSFEELEQEQNY